MSKDKIKQLEELGLTEAAKRLTERSASRTHIKQALENYKYATKRDIDAFNEQVRQHGKRLEIVLLKDYKTVPPDDVLQAIEGARELGCFTSFHVAHVVRVKDPIVFGRVAEFNTLYFFIAQWGDDVKFSDLVGDENA